MNLKKFNKSLIVVLLIFSSIVFTTFNESQSKYIKDEKSLNYSLQFKRLSVGELKKENSISNISQTTFNQRINDKDSSYYTMVIDYTFLKSEYEESKVSDYSITVSNEHCAYLNNSLKGNSSNNKLIQFTVTCNSPNILKDELYNIGEITVNQKISGEGTFKYGYLNSYVLKEDYKYNTLPRWSGIESEVFFIDEDYKDEKKTTNELFISWLSYQLNNKYATSPSNIIADDVIKSYLGNFLTDPINGIIDLNQEIPGLVKDKVKIGARDRYTIKLIKSESSDQDVKPNPIIESIIRNDNSIKTRKGIIYLKDITLSQTEEGKTIERVDVVKKYIEDYYKEDSNSVLSYINNYEDEEGNIKEDGIELILKRTRTIPGVIYIPNRDYIVLDENITRYAKGEIFTIITVKEENYRKEDFETFINTARDNFQIREKTAQAFKGSADIIADIVDYNKNNNPDYKFKHFYYYRSDNSKSLLKIDLNNNVADVSIDNISEDDIGFGAKIHVFHIVPSKIGITDDDGNTEFDFDYIEGTTPENEVIRIYIQGLKNLDESIFYGYIGEENSSLIIVPYEDGSIDIILS